MPKFKSAAELVTAIMDRRNYVLEEMAEELGTSVSTVWRIRNGEQVPSSDTYLRLLELDAEDAA